MVSACRWAASASAVPISMSPRTSASVRWRSASAPDPGPQRRAVVGVDRNAERREQRDDPDFDPAGIPERFSDLDRIGQRRLGERTSRHSERGAAGRLAGRPDGAAWRAGRGLRRRTATRRRGRAAATGRGDHQADDEAERPDERVRTARRDDHIEMVATGRAVGKVQLRHNHDHAIDPRPGRRRGPSRARRREPRGMGPLRRGLRRAGPSLVGIERAVLGHLGRPRSRAPPPARRPRRGGHDRARLRDRRTSRPGWRDAALARSASTTPRPSSRAPGASSASSASSSRSTSGTPRRRPSRTPASISRSASTAPACGPIRTAGSRRRRACCARAAS